MAVAGGVVVVCVCCCVVALTLCVVYGRVYVCGWCVCARSLSVTATPSQQGASQDDSKVAAACACLPPCLPATCLLPAGSRRVGGTKSSHIS